MTRADGVGTLGSALALLVLGVLAVPLVAVWLTLPLVPLAGLLAQLAGLL